MAIATGATGAVGTGVGVAKFFEGRSMQKEGERFIENFEWNDLENPYEDLSVSTLGAEMVNEQTNIGSASAVEALRQGGTRGIIGGLGRVEANRNNINTQTAANLDGQQKVLDRDKAQQEVLNQNMIEKRQTDELAGYGQMVNVGMGLKNQGLSDVVNGIGSISQGLAGMEKPEAPSPISTLKPAGLTYSSAPTTSMGTIPTAQYPWQSLPSGTPWLR
jgi:hypothetical protein